MSFEEDLSLFLGKFGIWTYPIKFYVYGRKIEDRVEWLENNKSEKEIKEYLKKCVYYRKKFSKETETEKYYKKKVVDLLKKYKINE